MNEEDAKKFAKAKYQEGIETIIDILEAVKNEKFFLGISIPLEYKIFWKYVLKECQVRNNKNDIFKERQKIIEKLIYLSNIPPPNKMTIASSTNEIHFGVAYSKNKNLLFELNFINGKKIIEPILDYMNKSFNGGFSSTGYFAPEFNIFQSSGFGKTRTALELGRHLPLIYFSFNDGEGVPPGTKILLLFLDEITKKFGISTLPRSHLVPVQIIYIFFIRLLYVLLSYRKDKKSKEAIVAQNVFDSIAAGKGISMDELYKELKKDLFSMNNPISGDIYKDLPHINIGTIDEQFREFTFTFGKGREPLKTSNIENDLINLINEYFQYLHRNYNS